MSLVSEIVARLIAAGTPAEDAAIAVTEAFAAGASCGKSGGIPVDEAAERRRAYDRDRKRLAAEIRRNSTENPQNSVPPFNLSASPQNSELPKEVKKVRARKALASEIPPDWQPSQAHHDAAQRLGLRLIQIEMKADDMRLWAKSNGVRKVDWDATFHGFLRRDAAKLTNGSGHGPENIRDKQRRESAEALAQLREFAQHGADDQGPSGGPRQPNARLLPFAKPA